MGGAGEREGGAWGRLCTEHVSTWCTRTISWLVPHIPLPVQYLSADCYSAYYFRYIVCQLIVTALINSGTLSASWLLQRLLLPVHCLPAGSYTRYYFRYIVCQLVVTPAITSGTLSVSWLLHPLLLPVHCLPAGCYTRYYFRYIVCQLVVTPAITSGTLSVSWLLHRLLLPVHCLPADCYTTYYFRFHNFHACFLIHWFMHKQVDSAIIFEFLWSKCNFLSGMSAFQIYLLCTLTMT